MAKRYRSRSRKTRRNVRRRKTFKRRGFRRSRRLFRRVYSFSRWAATPTNLSLTATATGRAETFSLDQLVSPSDFTTLYDRYRITTVVMYIQLISNPDSNSYLNQTSISNQANWYPKLWYAADYDDSATPAKTDLQQYQNVKCVILQPNKRLKLVVRPAILVEAYRSSVLTSYCPKWRQWVDMVQTDTPHYGLKLLFDTNGIDPDDTYPFKVSIEYKYYFQCKDVR